MGESDPQRNNREGGNNTFDERMVRGVSAAVSRPHKKVVLVRSGLDVLRVCCHQLPQNTGNSYLTRTGLKRVQYFRKLGCVAVTTALVPPHGKTKRTRRSHRLFEYSTMVSGPHARALRLSHKAQAEGLENAIDFSLVQTQNKRLSLVRRQCAHILCETANKNSSLHCSHQSQRGRSSLSQNKQSVQSPLNC